MTVFSEDIVVLQRRARRTANGLTHSGIFPYIDRDDLEQELLVDAWSRFRRFDPRRSATGTFAQRIMCIRFGR